VTYTMHPTLLVGPADWNAAAVPRSEFDRRIADLWTLARDAGGAIVFGGPSDHAALSYLTHFTPKLEPAIALIPHSGTPVLLVGGGANMLPAARPLTWISDLQPLRSLVSVLERWLPTLDAPPVLIGGDSMAHSMREEIDRIPGQETPYVSGDAIVAGMMARKSVNEVGLLRKACDALTAASLMLSRSITQGVPAVDSVLAAERAAFQHGAQDVRSLFGPVGGRLSPFEHLTSELAGPFQVYLAVQRDGYWVEAFLVAGDASQNSDRTRRVLERITPEIVPGRLLQDVDPVISAALHGAAWHEMAKPAVVSLGLSIGARVRPEAAFGAGEVLSLRVGSAGGAVVSSILSVTSNGTEPMWSAA
jgi:hypothetical protein